MQEYGSGVMRISPRSHHEAGADWGGVIKNLNLSRYFSKYPSCTDKSQMVAHLSTTNLRMLWREKDLKSVMNFEREISMYGQDDLWEFSNITKHFQAQTSLELGQSIHHDFKGLFQNVSSPTRKVPTASPPRVAGTKCYLENWTENLCTWQPKVREL